MAQEKESISLPAIATVGEQPLQKLLQQRRSLRKFEDAPLALSEIGQILWAGQGITDPAGLRTAPSAGALYPLELYLIAGEVEGVAPGIYRYSPGSHHLIRTAEGDLRKSLAKAALEQSWIVDAAAVLLVAAVYERTTWKYGRRGVRYIHIEVGHVAQNVYLHAEALGLGTTAVGAFDDGKVAELLRLPADTRPLLLMPLGRR
jgi:SagB-type dehydrogenase family enzyme